MFWRRAPPNHWQGVSLMGPTLTTSSGTFHSTRDDTREDMAMMTVSTAWYLIADLNSLLPTRLSGILQV